MTVFIDIGVAARGRLVNARDFAVLDLEAEGRYNFKSARCCRFLQLVLAVRKARHLCRVALELNVLSAGFFVSLHLSGLTLDCDLGKCVFVLRIQAECRLALFLRDLVAADCLLVDRHGLFSVRHSDRIAVAVVAGFRAGACELCLAVIVGAVGLHNLAVLNHKGDRRIQHGVDLAVCRLEGRTLVRGLFQRVGAVRQSGDDRILVGRIPCDAVCRISRITLGVLNGQLVIALAVLCIQHGACFIRLHKRQNQLRAFQRIVICDVLLGDRHLRRLVHDDQLGMIVHFRAARVRLLAVGSLAGRRGLLKLGDLAVFDLELELRHDREAVRCRVLDQGVFAVRQTLHVRILVG